MTGPATSTLADGVVAGFTERRLAGPRPPYDGNLAGHVGDDPADVAANRERLLAATGAARLCFAGQVHGTDVAVVGADHPAGIVDAGEADALVTTEAGTAVAVLVADCVPVLIADPVAGVVGAVHAGRRGLAAGVVQATLQAMAARGAVAPRSVALVGPAVCAACYEVPAAMRDEVAARVPETAATTRSGTPALDLPAGTAAILAAAGVEVHRDGRCTMEDLALFSHRRDGVTGRFAGWIMRR